MTERNAKVDDFVRAEDEHKLGPSSQLSTLSRSSLITSRMPKKKVDPYNLDFPALREEYVRDQTMKVPFVKSSFIHYSKCPRKMTINGRLYKDLVLTMELVQAPNCLDYSMLSDPQLVKAQEKERRKQEAIQKKKDEKARAKAALKAESRAAKEHAREERLREKE